ncbi:MAG: ion transporter [Bacteroidales bacterium]|nr:ion transporter [Bacteroidales bacterium]
MKKHSLKTRWYNIIFKHDTKAGQQFDVWLLILIILSVLVVCLDSIKQFNIRYASVFLALEWIFTAVFTIEYIVRILVVQKKTHYLFSFYGIIDFLSVLPSYLSIVYAGAQFLIIIRVLRLLRVFRILKLVRFTNASGYLMLALKHSREKIIVFLGTVLMIVTVMGALMYLVEGTESGFDSIPRSIYWAIVTITTVGYGDIAPVTVAGQIIAAVLMITGYAIIAVPTGIITAEMTRANHQIENRKPVCPKCESMVHDADARFCKRCGEKLPL